MSEHEENKSVPFDIPYHRSRAGTQLPWIPKPEPKAHPVHEELLAGEGHKDTRLLAKRPHGKILIPRFNHLYGGLRSDGSDWRYLPEITFNLPNNTIAAATAITSIALTLGTSGAFPSSLNLLLERWPGAVQMYLVLLWSSFNRQAGGPATAGDWLLQIQGQSGPPLPIGLFHSANNAQSSYSGPLILPTPVTDPGNPNIGNFIVTPSLSTATTFQADVQLTFSALYVLPTVEGFDTELSDGTIHEPIYSNHTD